MSATTIASALVAAASSSKPSFMRVVRIELRKLYDTRVRLALVAVIVPIMIASAGLMQIPSVKNASFVATSDFSATFMAAATTFALLPFITILLVTSEFSARSAMTTFCLVSGRLRVLGAKFAAMLILSLGTVAAAVIVTCGALAISGKGLQPDWWQVLGLGVRTLLEVTAAFALATVLLETVSTYVMYFVIPLAFTMVASLGTTVAKASMWISPLAMSATWEHVRSATVYQWAQAGTATLFWVVVMGLIGMARFNRAEVK